MAMDSIEVDVQTTLTPSDLAQQFKATGQFDALRKLIMSNYIESSEQEVLSRRLTTIVQNQMSKPTVQHLKSKKEKHSRIINGTEVKDVISRTAKELGEAIRAGQANGLQERLENDLELCLRRKRDPTPIPEIQEVEIVEITSETTLPTSDPLVVDSTASTSAVVVAPTPVVITAAPESEPMQIEPDSTDATIDAPVLLPTLNPTETATLPLDDRIPVDEKDSTMELDEMEKASEQQDKEETIDEGPVLRKSKRYP